MAASDAPPILDITPDNDSINLIVYGHPGSGKTPLAASSPRCLILDADDGIRSASIAGPTTAKRWPISDWDGMEEAHEFLRHNPKEFGWVWLDGITLFQELGLDDVLADVVADKPHRDPDIPDRPEYLKNMNRLSKWIRHVKALPFNFGVTAHVMTLEQSTGDLLGFPYIHGRAGGQPLATKICGYFDIVGYLYESESQERGRHRVLQTRSDASYHARDRFGKLPARVINPTIPGIERAIRGGSAGTPKRRPVKKAGARRSAR